MDKELRGRAEEPPAFELAMLSLTMQAVMRAEHVSPKHQGSQ